jgi:hypothetical protein
LGCAPPESEPTRITELLPNARQAFRWVLKNEECVRRKVAEEWTDEYNQNARDRDEDPEPITHEEFAKRIRLSGFSYRTGERIELSYDDAYMFGGHSLRVACDLRSGVILVVR